LGEVRMVISHELQRLPTLERLRDPALAWRVDAKRNGGGIFFDAVGHTLDFLDYLFGPIAEVRAFAANQAGTYAAEDVVSASYRFESGVYGSGSWCYSADID